jgi:hypothetical protein
MGTIIIKDVPEDLKREFKAICALRGMTLKDTLINLMSKEVEKERKKNV